MEKTAVEASVRARECVAAATAAAATPTLSSMEARACRAWRSQLRAAKSPSARSIFKRRRARVTPSCGYVSCYISHQELLRAQKSRTARSVCLGRCASTSSTCTGSTSWSGRRRRRRRSSAGRRRCGGRRRRPHARLQSAAPLRRLRSFSASCRPCSRRRGLELGRWRSSATTLRRRSMRVSVLATVFLLGRSIMRALFQVGCRPAYQRIRSLCTGFGICCRGRQAAAPRRMARCRSFLQRTRSCRSWRRRRRRWSARCVTVLRSRDSMRSGRSVSSRKRLTKRAAFFGARCTRSQPRLACSATRRWWAAACRLTEARCRCWLRMRTPK
mmetsp:Transcript_10738/g.22843  ORF Transcript_10738/g.22843 Transcript_10738/m.22843 type:complete len:329 (-) Transcript_10738:1411-2397(-)